MLRSEGIRKLDKGCNMDEMAEGKHTIDRSQIKPCGCDRAKDEYCKKCFTPSRYKRVPCKSPKGG